MKTVFAAIAAFLLASSPASAGLSGAATVVDGDTLEIDGATVDLFAIDAPELGQFCRSDSMTWACGLQAAELLLSLIEGAETRCEDFGRARDGTMIGKCSVNGLDLGAEMVTRGFAVAEHETSGYYLPNQREARGTGRGIFGGVFVPPAEWREGRRLEPDPDANTGCSCTARKKAFQKMREPSEPES